MEKSCLDAYKSTVISNFHLFNLLLPLIRRGTAKKVVAISSGHADLDMINKVGVTSAVPYSMSKAALNILVAKFSGQYSREGILFLSLSPGLVDTGSEGKEKFERKFSRSYPHFLKRTPSPFRMAANVILGG